MRILYFHGLGDNLEGPIPAHLRQHGWQVDGPNLACQNFEQCLSTGQTEIDRYEPDVIVGYSLGAVVLMNIDPRSIPYVLVAPGLKYLRDTMEVKGIAVIVISENDECASPDDCRELLDRCELPSKDHLIVKGKDHLMSDREALAAIVEAIERVRLLTAGGETIP